MRRHALLVLALSTFACQGATGESSEERPLSKATQPIVGGTASDASEDQVVLLLTHVPKKDQGANKYYEQCTGTLLAPNIVLTARHCISATTAGTFTCADDGSLTSGPGGTVLEDYVPADTHVLVGPMLPTTVDPTTWPGKGASYVHDAGTVMCNHDVALVILEAPIADAKIAPIRLDGDVTLGEGLLTVGWGATTTDFIPPSRQRRDGVSVFEVGPSSVVHLGGSLAASEFLATESVCTGDSGGPAFDSQTGAVVGVVSRGVNNGPPTNGSGCLGTQHTFMKTSSFADLVAQAFAAAGGTPWLEGKPAPGQGGAGGAASGNGGAGGDFTDKVLPADSSSCTVGHGNGDASMPMLLLVVAGALALTNRRTRKASSTALRRM